MKAKPKTGAEQKDVVVQVEPVRVEWTVNPVTVKMRAYYSMYHRWSAAHFAAMAGSIEDSHRGETRFDIRHRSFVTGAIFAATSFLESAINELLKDAADVVTGRISHSDYGSSLSSNVLRAYATLWQNERQYSILRKYSEALSLAGRPAFDEAQQSFDNARVLILLRNELVHFKPETLGGDDRHRLEELLKDRFRQNRLMDGSGNPFFPDKCLGYGCCRWAVESSQALADEFFQRMDLPPKYRAVEWPDPSFL